MSLGTACSNAPWGLNGYVLLCSVNLESLWADWWEAEGTSMSAGPPTPIKAAINLHSFVLLELGTPWAVRIQARVNAIPPLHQDPTEIYP